MSNRNLFAELILALDEVKQHSEDKLPVKQSEMISGEVGDSFEEGMSFHLVVTQEPDL
ncbi:hypothetical protein SAMN02745753_04289 [Marinomonas polaris DSM 16579]|uniref:Uncharacterized protein n=1 Tax=Marinomonas polaris DSM 16579 TaxID=1122206 RepID=A0A1M5LL00_9GAMM|nr:hypothetical protein [Marinomonas polaris]SHG65685.1 hypothetical protein SAMN02745753_04289 [Marinomonas polaris DSM 16579]